MKFNGVPVNFDDLHSWTMVNKDGVGRPNKLEDFATAFQEANILQVTQDVVGSCLYTTIWFVDELELKEAKRSRKEE